MAAAKRIRRAQHRDVVGRQICEHLRCMLGAEEGRSGLAVFPLNLLLSLPEDA